MAGVLAGPDKGRPGLALVAAQRSATVTLRLLGRPTWLAMTLSRIEPYRLIGYTSLQRAFPPPGATALRRGSARASVTGS